MDFSHFRGLEYPLSLHAIVCMSVNIGLRADMMVYVKGRTGANAVSLALTLTDEEVCPL